MKIAIHKRLDSYSERWIEYCEKNNIKYINNLFILKAPFFVHKILIFLFLIFRYLNKFVKPKLIFK